LMLVTVNCCNLTIIPLDFGTQHMKGLMSVKDIAVPCAEA